MRVFVPSTLLIVVCIIASSPDIRAQVTDSTARQTLPGTINEGGTIDGRIVLPSGRSVGVPVKVILEVNGAPVQTVYSDATGVFHLRGIGVGRFDVRAYPDKRLYEPGGEVIDMAPDANVQTIIYLKPRIGGTDEDRVAGVVSADDLDLRAPRDAKKVFQKAQSMIEKGSTEDGLEQLKHAISIYPDYASARNALGIQYLKRRQLPDASEQFEYILSKAPKYFDARFNLGLVRLEQQRYADAVTELVAASSVDSAKAACHMWLGVAYLQTADLTHAEQEMNRAQALGGKELTATRYYMGQIYARENRRDDACKQFQEYLIQAPTGDLAADSRRILESCGRK